MADDKKKLLGVDWEYEHRRRLKEKIYGIYRPEDDLPKDTTIVHKKKARKKVVVRRCWSIQSTKKYLEIAEYLLNQKLYGRCNTCHSKEELTYDHIYPTSKGGCKCKANVQVLCKSCNGRKGDAIFMDAHCRPFGHRDEDCPFKKENKP